MPLLSMILWCLVILPKALVLKFTILLFQSLSAKVLALIQILTWWVYSFEVSLHNANEDPITLSMCFFYSYIAKLLPYS